MLVVVSDVSLLGWSVEGARRVDLAERVAINAKLLNSPVLKRVLDLSNPSEKTLLGLARGEDTQVVATEVTASGTQKTRVVETYLGVPVWDSIAVLEKRDGQYTDFAFGNIYDGIQDDLPDVTPAITKAEALTIALNELGDSPSVVLAHDAKLYVYIPGDNKAHLVYELSYTKVKGASFSTPTFLIDAKDKNVHAQWEGFVSYNMKGDGGNAKTGRYTYGVDFGFLDVTRNSNGTCSYINNNVRVIHARNSGSFRFRDYTPINADCTTGILDEVNDGYSAANDAFYFGDNVVKMYNQWYSDSTLARYTPLPMRVHFGNNYENAFLSGTNMAFGDGHSTYYPLVSLDVMAHEVTHFVTRLTSKLRYSGQSGGMNEAFSDMAGEAAEAFVRSQNDFHVGAQIFKSQGAIRYMCNPPQDGRSIDRASNYRNGMDVHLSSGVYNKAFCLLAKRTGWGIKKSFGLFLRANKMYWSIDSTYATGFCGVISAAKDLNYNKDDVTASFSAVGVTGSCAGSSGSGSGSGS